MSRSFTFTSLLALACASVLSSCATTFNSSAPTTIAVSASTTTTIPSGTAQQLFSQLLSLASELGNDVAEGKSSQAKAKLADIKATWIGVQNELGDVSKDTFEDLQRMVNLLVSSVERKRPADADKAMRYLPLILEGLNITGQ